MRVPSTRCIIYQLVHYIYSMNAFLVSFLSKKNQIFITRQYFVCMEFPFLFILSRSLSTFLFLLISRIKQPTESPNIICVFDRNLPKIQCYNIIFKAGIYYSASLLLLLLDARCRALFCFVMKKKQKKKHYYVCVCPTQHLSRCPFSINGRCRIDYTIANIVTCLTVQIIE